jgi:multiple sugar transport system substrate-binding protein
MRGQIFISYRHEDSQWLAGRLYDRLAARFGREQVFMDIAIGLGDDFVKAIEKRVGECDVLVAVIGGHWLTSTEDEGGRRLNNPEDFVRMEIGTALRRDIRVIPVLVDGALIPRSKDLPDDLKGLVRRNALRVSHTGFDDDCRRLVTAIEQVLEKNAAEQLQQENGRLRADECLPKSRVFLAKWTKSNLVPKKWAARLLVLLILITGVTFLAVFAFRRHYRETDHVSQTTTVQPSPARMAQLPPTARIQLSPAPMAQPIPTATVQLSPAPTAQPTPTQYLVKNSGNFDWKQASGTKIKISLNRHPYADAIIQQLPRFRELTGIDVAQEEIPEEYYLAKLLVELLAEGGYPDVFMTGVYQMWDYASTNRIEPLDKYLDDPTLTNSGYKPEDIFEGVFDAGKWDLRPGDPTGTGNLYTLPLGFEMYSLAYNKKYFDENGLQPPKTLDGLIELSAKLKGWNGPESYGVAVPGTLDWTTISSGYISTFSSAGAKDFFIINDKLVPAVDSPEAITVTANFAKMIKEGGPPAWSNYTWYKCGADLGAGKAAILYDSDTNGYFKNVPGGSDQAGNIAFSPAPVVKPGDEPQSNEWVWQLGMNSSSKNKKAAWLFIQYFTGSEFELWAALNAKTMDPARKSIWENDQFKRKLSKVVGYEDTFQKTIANTGIKFTPQQYFVQSTTGWAATLQQIVLSGANPETAMKELAKRISRQTSRSNF